MQVSDSSSRILAGLLEARTGQQLTMNRRWRIETALASLLRERGIATLDELITILVMGREPALAQTTPAERLAMMWQLGLDAWAFMGDPVAEPRLPRHIVRVVRGRR